MDLWYCRHCANPFKFHFLSTVCCLCSGIWSNPIPLRNVQDYRIHNKAQGTICPFLFSDSLSLSIFHGSLCFSLTFGDGRWRGGGVGWAWAQMSGVSQPGNYTDCRTMVHTYMRAHKLIKHTSHMSMESDHKNHNFPSNFQVNTYAYFPVATCHSH